MKIYLASSLFNAREVLFNNLLADKLEDEGTKLFVPQRDGFEFADLNSVLSNHLSDSEVGKAVQQIIYHLDIGFFLYNSDAVLAVLDEPIDEGVVVEISYAKVMGIPVLGIRSDVRMPYGGINDPCRGMHFFPYYQCDRWILTKRHFLEEKEILIICEALSGFLLIPKENRQKIQHIEDIAERSKLLFSGLDKINTINSIQAVVARYLKNKDKFIDPEKL